MKTINKILIVIMVVFCMIIIYHSAIDYMNLSKQIKLNELNWEMLKKADECNSELLETRDLESNCDCLKKLIMMEGSDYIKQGWIDVYNFNCYGSLNKPEIIKLN